MAWFQLLPWNIVESKRNEYKALENIRSKTDAVTVVNNFNVKLRYPVEKEQPIKSPFAFPADGTDNCYGVIETRQKSEIS